MKFNDKEMIQVSQRRGQLEGRLQYKGPPGTFNSGFRERYFRLVGNLLFYFRFNDFGTVELKEPVGLIILANYVVSSSENDDIPFAFGLIFLDEPEKRHIFTTRNDSDVNIWVNALKCASYQYWKGRLVTMQKQLKYILEEKAQGDTLNEELVQKMKQLDPLSGPNPNDEKRLKETVPALAGAAAKLAPTSTFYHEPFSDADVVDDLIKL